MRIFMRCCAALAVCAAIAFCFDLTALKPQGYVSDFARVVDPGRREQLERYCARVEAATGVQMALVTVPALDGEPIEDVANALYRKWGVGRKDSNEGVLLLLSIQDRRSRLEVGYGLEPILPDGAAGSILRQMAPALREGHYGDALTEAAHFLAQRITQAKGVSLNEAPPQRRPRRSEDAIPWPMLIAGAGMLLWLLGMGGRGRGGGAGHLLAGMLLGNMMGRGGMGMPRSGGGFGGYDSGDSFGGFGGGDSGGGGASSRW